MSADSINFGRAEESSMLAVAAMVLFLPLASEECSSAILAKDRELLEGTWSLVSTHITGLTDTDFQVLSQGRAVLWMGRLAQLNLRIDVHTGMREFDLENAITSRKLGNGTYVVDKKELRLTFDHWGYELLVFRRQSRER